MAEFRTCVCTDPEVRAGACEACGRPLMDGRVLTTDEEFELAVTLGAVIAGEPRRGRQLLRRFRGRLKPNHVNPRG